MQPVSTTGQTFESYQPPEEACSSRKARWYIVYEDGTIPTPWAVSDRSGGDEDPADIPWPSVVHTDCDYAREANKYLKNNIGETYVTHRNEGDRREPGEKQLGGNSVSRVRGKQKFVYSHQLPWTTDGKLNQDEYNKKYEGEEGKKHWYTRYNFETGMFSNDQGEKYKNGERVE